MKKYTNPLTAVLLIGIFIGGMGLPDRARAVDVIVGAGDESPAHFNIGRALCRTISKFAQAMTCEVERIIGRDAAEPLAVLGNVRDGTAATRIATR